MLITCFCCSGGSLYGSLFSLSIFRKFMNILGLKLCLEGSHDGIKVIWRYWWCWYQNIPYQTFPSSNRKIDGYSIVFAVGNFDGERIIVYSRTNREIFALYILMFLWPLCSPMPWIHFHQVWWVFHIFFPSNRSRFLLMLPCFCVNFQRDSTKNFDLFQYWVNVKALDPCIKLFQISCFAIWVRALVSFSSILLGKGQVLFLNIKSFYISFIFI